MTLEIPKTMEDYPTILTTPVPVQPCPLNFPDVLINASDIIVETNMPSVAPSVPVFGIAHANNEASQLAVEVTNVHKSYGKTGADKVLDDFSMKVPAGAIYSLLGSSGCGKTTILSCIMGLRSWDSGKISVLGHEREVINADDTDAALSARISRRMGYMPQELALYEHLTVKEIIGYFGKLYGMPEPDISNRWKALTKLLELDSKRHVQIQELSGGQKRRVSLALALVSKPDLLILDEPTVGLDPILRRSIWIHLKELVYTNKTTVLITTHYIEETKYSNKIGILRHGRMLYEEHPNHLLSKYNCDLLQDAILQICRTDHDLRKSSLTCVTTPLSVSDNIPNRKLSTGFVPTHKTSSDSITIQKYKEIDPDQLYNQSHPDQYHGKEKLIEEEESSSLNSFYRNVFGYLGGTMGRSWDRTLSFSLVMWIYLLRQPIFAFILMFLPALQLFMTFAVVGKEPVDLKVGVINHELAQFPVSSHHRFCSNVTYFKDNSCNLNFLSCPIFSYLAESGKLDLMPMEEQRTAEELLKQGSIFGYIVFPANYSENLINRHMTGRFASDDETLDGSRLIITLDKSHYLAYHLVLKELYNSLENLSKHLDASCGFDHGYNEIPLHFRDPVYGRLDGTHQDSIMPAIVAQILFEILYGIAPMILIKDLRQGTFDRASLAGLRFSEFMLGIFVTMSPILLAQSVSCYFILEHGLNVGVRGSLSLFIFLCILSGLCGQGFGIFMGILVKSEFAVIVSAIMVIPLIMTCSGTLWPLESHPYYLKVIYYIFPSAPIVSSLRSVINRGVGLTHSLVWPGVLNTSLYSIAFWMLSIYRYKGMSRK